MNEKNEDNLLAQGERAEPAIANNKQSKEYGDELTVYTVKDIMSIFHLKKNKAYDLMHSRGFPLMRLNRSIYVTHENLIAWLRQHSKGKIEI